MIFNVRFCSTEATSGGADRSDMPIRRTGLSRRG